jgi:hypothetical protein
MVQAFITYARADEEPARLLRAELEKRGVQVAEIDRSIPPGESWIDGLQRIIAQSDLVLVLVSSNSERSEWINSEIALALSQAEQGRTRVVPVLLSPKVEPPFFLRNLQGITFFDRDRRQGQLDRLVYSVETGAARTETQAAQSRKAELNYLKTSKRALENEISATRVERSARSSVITSTIAVIAGFAILLAGLISFWALHGSGSAVLFGVGFLAGAALAYPGFLLLQRWTMTR